MACEKDSGSFLTPMSDSCKYTTKSLGIADFLSLVYLLNIAPTFSCGSCCSTGYSRVSRITWTSWSIGTFSATCGISLIGCSTPNCTWGKLWTIINLWLEVKGRSLTKIVLWNDHSH